MVQKGKWIDGVDPGDPVSMAARRALRVRLELVWYYAPLAALHSQRDPEYVHQLRVSTRRARATLASYHELLSPRRAEWMEKQLRRLRRAAGDARDYDVLLDRLSQLPDRRPTRGWEVLLQRIERLRWQAQQPLLERYRKLKRRDFARRARQLARRVAWRNPQQPEPTFAEAAQAGLRRIAEPFFAAAEGDLADVAALHQFRIHGKQLRYAMEVFAGALDGEFRGDLYRQVEQVQERLGQLNDHATGLARFRGWRQQWKDPALDGPLSQLIEREEAALAQAQRDFFRWWTGQRAAELRQRFRQLLAAAELRIASG
jgi:CHAD domain-containing protein